MMFKPSSILERVDPLDAPKYMRTCPHYYLKSPFVQSILADLEDYKLGRLGNSLDLPVPYLVYLRTAESERKCWFDFWESEAIAKASKK